MKRQLRGFTLIELLAVIAIIGILATLAAIGISDALKRAHDSVRESDLTKIKQSLELYNQDNGGYPTTNSQLRPISDLSQPLDSYIKPIPHDSKAIDKKSGTVLDSSKDYQYASNGTDYLLYAQLEYAKTQPTLNGMNCTDAKSLTAPKGNGVAQDQNSAKACFRLTND